MVKLQTNFGEITIDLDAEKAPITVANFLSYVESGFYNGTIFHRVIDGFMIQGGGFTPEMSQKNTNPTIKNEANNGLKNKTYTLAMARTPAPDSAASQVAKFCAIARSLMSNCCAPPLLVATS